MPGTGSPASFACRWRTRSRAWLPPGCHPRHTCGRSARRPRRAKGGCSWSRTSSLRRFAIEEELRAAGYEVLGPVASAERALPLIATPGCEAALVDANLDGRPVDDIVAALTEQGCPSPSPRATAARRCRRPSGTRRS
ncbi:MAG: hypothetical protein R3D25_19195 [Geminicoccaceae bacterium]